jgi:hypothetical protein
MLRVYKGELTTYSAAETAVRILLVVPETISIMPLLSDHEPLIRWLMHNDRPYDMGRAENHRTYDFHGYQALLALRGEWDRLAARCERVLADEPVAKKKKHLIDRRFYLALARGDKPGMEAVLSELTSSKIARVRNNEQAFAFTHFFIGTHAVIYAKIAWRHGYKVEVDTPFIPREWLPISPLPAYHDPYPFMQAFPIDTPLPERGKS